MEKQKNKPPQVVQTNAAFPKALINYTAPKTRLKTSKKTTVVSGQTMSLQAMLHKLKAGIPMQATSRTVETYYRGLDLVDQHDMQKAYNEKATKIREQRELYARNRQEALEQDRKAFEHFKKQFNEQKEPNATGPTP